jgi:hypothetical protein
MARPTRRRQDKLKRFKEYLDLGSASLKLGFQLLRLAIAATAFILFLLYAQPIAEKSAELLVKLLLKTL